MTRSSPDLIEEEQALMTAERGPTAGAEHGPVGMVGVGNMGGRVTRRLTGAGYDVLAGGVRVAGQAQEG